MTEMTEAETAPVAGPLPTLSRDERRALADMHRSLGRDATPRHVRPDGRLPVASKFGGAGLWKLHRKRDEERVAAMSMADITAEVKARDAAVSGEAEAEMDKWEDIRIRRGAVHATWEAIRASEEGYAESYQKRVRLSVHSGVDRHGKGRPHGDGPFNVDRVLPDGRYVFTENVDEQGHLKSTGYERMNDPGDAGETPAFAPVVFHTIGGKAARDMELVSQEVLKHGLDVRSPSVAWEREGWELPDNAHDHISIPWSESMACKVQLPEVTRAFNETVEHYEDRLSRIRVPVDYACCQGQRCREPVELEMDLAQVRQWRTLGSQCWAAGMEVLREYVEGTVEDADAVIAYLSEPLEVKPWHRTDEEKLRLGWFYSWAGCFAPRKAFIEAEFDAETLWCKRHLGIKVAAERITRRAVKSESRLIVSYGPTPSVNRFTDAPAPARVSIYAE